MCDQILDRQCLSRYRNYFNRLENQFRRDPHHDPEETVIIDKEMKIYVLPRIKFG